MYVLMKHGVPIQVTKYLNMALQAQTENETPGAPVTIIPVTPVAAAPKREPVQLELPLDDPGHDFDDLPTNPEYRIGPRGPTL